MDILNYLEGEFFENDVFEIENDIWCNYVMIESCIIDYSNVSVVFLGTKEIQRSHKYNSFYLPIVNEIKKI